MPELPEKKVFGRGLASLMGEVEAESEVQADSEAEAESESQAKVETGTEGRLAFSRQLAQASEELAAARDLAAAAKAAAVEAKELRSSSIEEKVTLELDPATYKVLSDLFGDSEEGIGIGVSRCISLMSLAISNQASGGALLLLDPEKKLRKVRID